jgi:signal transduction histidine kinase/ActR/RegA family two-component response regulator
MFFKHAQELSLIRKLYCSGFFILALTFTFSISSVYADSNSCDILSLELLEDAKHNLSIEHILTSNYQQKFQSLGEPVPKLGHSKSTWWIKLKIHNIDQSNKYLLLDRNLGGEISAYLQTEHELSNLKRIAALSYPTYPLHLPANTQAILYLKIRNYYNVLTVPIKILNTETLFESYELNNFYIIALFAGLAVLTLYNFLLFIGEMKLGYLSLSIFTFNSIIIFIIDFNLFPSFFLLSYHNNYLYVLPFILMVTSAFYYGSAIESNQETVLTKICLYGARISLITIFLLKLIPDLEFVLYVVIIFILPILIIALTVKLWNGRQNLKPIFIAVLVLFICITPNLFMRLELLDYKMHWLLISKLGVLLSVLILSYYQGQQTRLLREQKDIVTHINNAKDSFLATLSHELRTPMHAIIGVGALMRETPLSAEQLHYLEKLDIAAVHMLSLVNELLDLSRATYVGLKLNKVNFNLENLLNQVQQICLVMARKKGVTLVVNLQNANINLYGDSKRLFQILSNLVNNAIKYTDVTGYVKLNYKLILLDTNNAELQFEIIDTGKGISREQLKHLFEPFYSPHNEPIGIGLGLTISAKLVEAMGGELKVESMVQQGSRFYFALRLPICAAPESVHQVAHLTASHSLDSMLATLQILLVDDDEINQFVGKKFLEKQGASVVIAENGEAALNELDTQHFDVILMDISMPAMDGYTLTKHIRTHKLWRSIPIIAMTAHVTPGYRERCLAAGMNDFIGKPFDMETLLDVIKRCLDMPVNVH